MPNEERNLINIVTLRRDLYIVLSLLLADKAVGKLGDAFRWTGDFYEDESRRLLLWIAVAVRSLLNDKAALEPERCGEYWADIAKDKPADLTLRQACNSIIHSDEILLHHIFGKRNPDEKVVYFNRISVRGSHRNRATRALIDIIQFAEAANNLLNHLGDSHADL